MRTRTMALPILAAALLLGCTGTTEPTGSLQVGLFCALLNPALNPTILKIEVLWDDRVVGTEEAFDGRQDLGSGGQFTSSPGIHTITIRLVRQEVPSASASYVGGGELTSTNSKSGAAENISFGPSTKALTTNGSISFAVTLK